MKVCPQCNAHYDDSMFFCLEDGTPLRSLQNSTSSNPATFEKTLTLPTEEKTVALPTEERTFNLPVTEEKTLNLPKTSEETAAFPTEATKIQESAPTVAWQPDMSSPKNIPAAKSEEKNYELHMMNDLYANESSGNGKVILGVVLGGLVLLGSALGGWWFLRSSSNDVATANVNTKTENANNLILPNISGFHTNNNTNISNANVSSSPIATANQSTPKTSPTKDKSPTPAPVETPNATQTETPISKTPTPVPKTPTPKPVPDTVSGGVLNGKAVNLVKPPYPPAAKAVRAAGTVNVQVTIDENGNVISASAVSGHALLRGAAESAARASKFSPTTLSGQRVKVTGIISYNFVAQ